VVSFPSVLDRSKPFAHGGDERQTGAGVVQMNRGDPSVKATGRLAVKDGAPYAGQAARSRRLVVSDKWKCSTK
jgi:hypothetical protein